MHERNGRANTLFDDDLILFRQALIDIQNFLVEGTDKNIDRKDEHILTAILIQRLLCPQRLIID